MAVAFATLIKRIRRELQDEPWEDKLTAAVTTTGQLSVTVGNPGSWAEGDRMEFDDASGDVARVTSAADGTNPVPIKRGHNESTAATHLTAVVVLKNPRYEYNAISDVLNDAIAALWPDTWVALATATVTPVAGTIWYAATSGAVGLISAKQLLTGSSQRFVDYGRRFSGLPVSFELRHPGFTDAPAVGFTRFQNTSNNVRVIYAAKVDSSTVADGDTAKLVVIDSCRRLLEGEEIERGSADIAQGDTGIPSGGLIRNAAYFAQIAEKYRRDMALQTKRDLPLMRPWGR